MKKVLFIVFLGLVAGGAAAQVDPSYIDAQRPDKEVLITKDSVLTYFNLGSFLQDSLGIPYDNLANGAVLVGSPSGGITSYPLQFYYANADKLLGIGTTSPEAGIHIANNRVSLAKFERTTSDSAFFELVNSVQTYYFQINEDGSFEIKQGNERPFKIGDQVEINAPVWFKDTIRSYDGTTGAVGHVWTVAANGKPEWTDPGTLTNDDQRFDTAGITDDTLYLSLTGDGEPAKEIDLKPYSNTADDQAIEQFDISNDSLRLKLENSAQARVFLEDFKQDSQSLFVVGDSLGIRRGNKIDLNDLRTSQEEIEDIVGGMVSGNTETDITVDYDDPTGKLNFVVTGGGGGGTDDQTVDTFELSGTDLRLSLEGDGEPFQVVDLSGLGGGTDDQTIDTLRLVGTTLEVSLEGDGEPKQTVDLSSLQDGTGTDDQTLSFTSPNLSIENGNSVDLSPLQDGTGTDDQTIDKLNLNGTTLEVSLEDDGAPDVTVDLSSLQDGTGTDDQTVDKFNLNGTTLELSLENDGQPDATVNLSSLQDGTGTDDQDLTLVGNTLSIENDPNTDVDLTPYEKLTQTEVQDYVKPMVSGNIETLIDVSVTSQRFDFVVEDDLSLYDNTTSGFLTNEVDGSVTNEIQTIDTFRLVGTTLEGSLSSDGEAKKTVDLSGLQDGVFDGDAIHDNVSDEFSGVSQKLAPSNADRILIEDSGASFAKKWIRVDSLPSSGGGGGSDGVATGGTHDQINRELDITVAAPGSNFSIDISALPTDLEDLTDVGLPIAYTNRFALLADGTDFHARAITEADISDLQSYLTAEVDGSVTNEIQNVDLFSLSGTDLQLSLTDQASVFTADLSPLQDGTGTDDQTLDVSQLVGTDLQLSLENDGEATKVIDLSSLQDGTGTDDQDLTLVGNTLAIENDPNTDVDLSPYLDNTDDQNLDVGTFSTGTGDLTIGIEDGTDQVINLDGRYLQSEVDGSTSNELQDFDITNLNGTDLELSLTQDATTHTVDLSSLQDGTGTDDQNLSFDPKSGTDVTLNIQDGIDVTFREGTNITLNRSGSNLLELSATGDGTGTDDQNIEGLSFNSVNGDLTVGIEDGGSQVTNLDGRYLQSEVDGSTLNELQDFDVAQLTGTDLELSLTQDATTWTVDLSSLDGGAGIDTLVDYDALRAYVGSSNVVYVQDFNVTYLGDVYKTYGGLFVNGATGENGATIIDGWQRVFDGVNYLADWYEMNGYDDSGVDNTVLIENDRINAIIRVANTNGGGVVHLTPGVKNVDDAGVYSGSNRYAVRLLSNIELNGHGATIRVDTNLIDGTFTLDILHSVSDTNVIVRNLNIDGNTAEQSWSTYEQTGKTFGIRLHATSLAPSLDFLFENLQINDVFGNSIFTKGNDTDYDVSFRNLDLVNITCLEYGEGPVFEQVQDIRVENLYVDPNAVAVGDHLEFVRCQDYEVDGYTCVGGSGSGSGIDIFGSKNGTHSNFIIKNVANGIEVHKDNNGNYPSNLRFDHGSISDPLQATVNGIVLETGNGSSTDIHFSNITLDSFYNGVMINDSEGVPGPVTFSDVVIRNCTQSGYQLQTVQDISIVGGEVYGCNDHGIYWNSQLNETAITGEANLNAVGVKIYNNDNDGVRLDMSNGTKTYSLKANIDVDAFDNGDDDVWANQGSSDTNRIYFVNSENVLAPTTSFNNYAVYGITDMYPNANLQRMFGVHGQKIRVHGKNGGIQLQNGLLDHTMIFLDSASNVTIDSLEWIEFHYSFIEKRWFETDRRNKTEIVDVHGKFVPDTEWPLLSANRVPYWDGSNFIDDIDLTYDGDNLGVKRVDLADSLNFYNLTTWAGGMYRSGWDIIHKSAAAGGFRLWYDHNNNLIFHLYNTDRSARFYGDVEFDAGIKDVNNSTGSSGQILSSTGTATDWITGDLTDDQTLSWASGTNELTISGGNTVDLSSLAGGGGGGDVYKFGTPSNRQISVWLNDSTIQSWAGFEIDGADLLAPDFESDDGYEFVTGATRQADIYWDGSNLIYQNATAASNQIFQNNIGQEIMRLSNGTRQVTIENDLQVKGGLMDVGNLTGSLNQVPLADGSGGWNWGAAPGIDSVQLDLSPELGGDLHLGGKYFTESFVAGEVMTIRDVCTIDTDLTDGELYDASATDVSRCSGYIFLTTDATTDGTETRVITEGKVTGFAGLTAGDIYYVSTVAGNITNVAPSGSGQIVRKIGQAINATTIYFKPDETWVEVP